MISSLVGVLASSRKVFASDLSYIFSFIPCLSLICSEVFDEEYVVLLRSSEEPLTGTEGHIFLELCELKAVLVGGGRGGSAWMRIGEDLKEGDPCDGFCCILDGELCCCGEFENLCSPICNEIF